MGLPFQRQPRTNLSGEYVGAKETHSYGETLTPLAQWLALWQPRLSAREAWAVDPFRLASNKMD